MNIGFTIGVLGSCWALVAMVIRSVAHLWLCVILISVLMVEVILVVVTCGFDLATFSILIHASSRSFHLAFSLAAQQTEEVWSHTLDNITDITSVYERRLTCFSQLWTAEYNRQITSDSSPWTASERYRSDRESSWAQVNGDLLQIRNHVNIIKQQCS